MAEGNGQLTEQQQREHLNVLASVLVDRLQYGARLGESYGGDRKVYDALGWPKTLSWQDFYARYSRQDIAARIVDLPADATWREGFELADNDDPDSETPFEKAWKDLDKRLRLSAWLQRLDRICGIGEYAVLYLGMRGQQPDQPLRKATRPEDLAYVSVFAQPSADVETIDNDTASERFGLPETYSLRVAERVSDLRTISTSGRMVRTHWSRCIHAAEGLEETKIYGRPRLQRVFNLLHALELVVGATGEAYWRAARPRYHLNIQKDYAGGLDPMLREQMGEELAKLLHGMQDFIRTSGTDLNQLTPGIADPRGPVEVLVDLIASASGIPKRILLGSERGELASSQDAQEWAHRVAERIRSQAEPVLVRPMIDRLVEAGVLPEPSGGEYEVSFPDITGPTAEQRAALAERMAKAEATHAQAEMLGHPIMTKNELRDSMGLPGIPDIEEDYPGQREEERKEVEAEEQLLLPPPEEAEVEEIAGGDQEDEENPARANELRAAAASFAGIMRAVAAASDRIMRSRTVAAIQTAALDLAQRTAARLGLTPEQVDPATFAARQFMLEYGADRVSNISETTRRLLRETLTEGLRNNETDAQLARRVRVYFRQASRGRARVIAATEAHRAASFGALEGMLQAGAPLKRWTTQRDDQVRETHDQMDGQTVPVGEPFTAPNGEKALYPGGFPSPDLSINCRCYPEPVELPSNLQALAQSEFPRRLAVHERRVLAAVRRALREQQAAVLRELSS